MKRWFALPLLAAALALAPRADAQQPDEAFGTLVTKPAPAAAPAAPAALPAGVEPARPTTTAAANPFPLPADAGAWLICAAAYSGPDGADLARQVCVELREKHKLRAYIYNRGDEERKQQEEEWQRLKQAHPGAQLRRKGVRVVDHYAVLIAGWPDHKAAGDYLPRVKEFACPDLKLEGGKSPYEIFTSYEIDPKTNKEVAKYGRVNPYHSAMITRNPLTPNTAPAKPKFDPIWEQLNEDEEYSLLKSRAKYSLIVKEYTGPREIHSRTNTSKVLSAIGFGHEGEGLDAAAKQAHETAKFLRQALQVKAFVLHMRSTSVVTVGEFNSLEDPELQRVLRLVTAMRCSNQKDGGGSDPIGLMPNPLPVEVPRP